MYIHDILHLNPVRRVPVSLILLASTIGAEEDTERHLPRPVRSRTFVSGPCLLPLSDMRPHLVLLSQAQP